MSNKHKSKTFSPYFDGDCSYTVFLKEKGRPFEKGMTKFSFPPNPPTAHYHYSNRNSQNSLIVETQGFPAGWRRDTQEIHSAYSDRMYSWDADRMKKVCEIAGGGDQNWGYCLQGITDVKLKELAQVAFNLAEPPLHVQVVHHYNVSSGYSCPSILAICKKKK